MPSIFKQTRAGARKRRRLLVCLLWANIATIGFMSSADPRQELLIDDKTSKLEAIGIEKNFNPIGRRDRNRRTLHYTRLGAETVQRRDRLAGRRGSSTITRCIYSANRAPYFSAPRA
jgi:hypothetical protein